MLSTNPAAGLTLLRVAVGLIFFSHGLSKLFLHVPGQGDLRWVDALVTGLASWGFPVPLVLAWSVALLEFAGGITFAAGWLVRPLAAYYAFQILLGIYLVHGQHGWYTVGPGRNGVEFSVLILASLATLVVAGHGRPLPRPRFSG